MKTFKHIQAGFSMVEIIVAMVIIAAGLLGVAGFQGSLFSSKTESKQQSEAISMAQQKLEIMRAFGTIADFDLFTCDTADACRDTVEGTTANYTRTWAFTPNESTASTPYKSVTVNVSWVTSTGQNKTVSLNSLLARRDPSLSGILASDGASGTFGDSIGGTGTAPVTPTTPTTPPAPTPTEPTPTTPPTPPAPTPTPTTPTPPTPPKLRFSISASGFFDNPSISITIKTTSGSTTGGSCTTVAWSSNSSGSFVCTVPATWSGEVIVTGGGNGGSMSRICPGNISNNKTFPFSNVTADATLSFTTERGNKAC